LNYIYLFHSSYWRISLRFLKRTFVVRYVCIIMPCR
jgi:hypothetical protein